MKVNVKVNIDCNKILQSRGLGKDGTAAKYLANLVARYSDKRVPFQDGYLKNHHPITVQNGAAVLEYTQPYAHYQYHGQVMAGRAPKHYTGKALTYNQAPTRGSKWDVRTMQADGTRIVADFAKFVGGEPV